MTPDPYTVDALNSHRDKQLWAAVILQALEDAAGTVLCEGGGRKQQWAEINKSRIRQSARNWFRDAGPDFREVCALAGMDYEAVRTAALQKFEDVDAGKQNKNTRLLDYNGEQVTIAELSRKTGVPDHILRERSRKGITGDALIAPVSKPQPKTLTFSGQTHTYSEWSTLTGINAATIDYRIKKGWTVEEALGFLARNRPKRKFKSNRKPITGQKEKATLYEHDGKALTLREWSRLTGIPNNTLFVRIKRHGWTLERALRTPVKEKASSNPQKEAG
jgi:hypothetical protein